MSGETYASFCALGVLCELAAESQIVFRVDQLVENVSGLYLVDEAEWYDETGSFGAYVDPLYDIDQLDDYETSYDGPFEANAAGFAQTLPNVVRQWADLKLEHGGTTYFPAISSLNDDHRFTFSEIAAHIEEHWEAM